MALQFRHVGRTTVRDQVNANILAELEFGLLKKHSQDAKLGAAEKTVLLEMTIDHLEAQSEHMILEVNVRSLCHSRTVTADFLSFAERFNMKKCILCIGDVGSSDSPWAQLVQPAVYLFQKEYNILFIESPTLGKSPQRWMKYGPALYRGTLRFLKISTVNVFCAGSGGILFQQLLSDSPEILGPAHIAYNLDVPQGVKTLPFEIIKVEESLRDNNMQVWCMYQEDEDTTDPGSFSKSAEGPQKMFDALSKIQARLESERRRSGGTRRNYDEIIFSDRMNFPKVQNVCRVTVSKMSLHIFIDSCLEVMAHYFRQLPSTFQDNVNDGLVKDMLDYFREDMLDEFNMPAIKNVQLHRSEEARKVVAAANRERLELVQESMNILALGNSEKPSLEAPPAKVETLSLTRRSTGSKNAHHRRTKSNLTVVSEDEERIAEAVEDDETEDDQLFDDSQDYQSQWEQLNALKADYMKSPTSEKGAPTASSADPGPLAIEQGMPGD